MNIGCFGSQDECVTDVFVETLSPIQCHSLAGSLSGTCNSCGSYYWFYLETSMSPEICLLACSAKGFILAGLKE